MSEAKGRNLDDGSAALVLKDLVGETEAELCERKPEGAHACAASAVLMWAFSANRMLRYARDLLTARWKEIDAESIYIREKVEEHLIQMRNVVGCLHGVHFHVVAAPRWAAARIRMVREGIAETRDFVQEYALGRLEAALGDPAFLARPGRAEWIIDTVLRICTESALTDGDLLPKAERAADDLFGLLLADWVRDARSIRGDSTCCPSRGPTGCADTP